MSWLFRLLPLWALVLASVCSAAQEGKPAEKGESAFAAIENRLAEIEKRVGALEKQKSGAPEARSADGPAAGADQQPADLEKSVKGQEVKRS